MRLSWLYPALLLSPIFASASPAAIDKRHVEDASEDLPVPELRDLTPENFDKTVEKGYWYDNLPAIQGSLYQDSICGFDARETCRRVAIGEKHTDKHRNIHRFIKHFSPYCGHCRVAAPHWQTLYEFYMRSSPASPSSPHPKSPPSFTDTYDWHFANVDCSAHGDLCGEHGVNAYPMFGLFKDGKLIDTFKGKRNNIELLSEFMEAHLEEIKPGSRPAKIELPEVPSPQEFAAARSKAAATKKVTEPTAAPIAQTPLEAPVEEAAPLKPTKKKGPTPNPSGVSVPLDIELFQKKILNTGDGWFVKFYAPWCSHCQAMAPAWKTLGYEMQGTLNIGEVNCEVDRRLCKEAQVAAYPTIIFFKNGEKIEYKGLRGVGDLVSWARKAADSGIKEIGDAADFEVIQKKYEVTFLYFYDHATVSEDFEALSRITMPLIGHAPLYKTNSDLLARKYRITTWPQLIVLRDDTPSYYPALSPADIRDTEKIINWMKTVWLPVVPELSATNSHEIMNGRTVVLGIFDTSKEEEFNAAKAEMKAAAKIWMEEKIKDEKLERQELRDRKQHKIDEAEDRNDERALNNAKGMPVILPKRKEIGFAWVDGIFWERWVKQTYNIDVKEMGNRVIINEEDKKRYWDANESDEPIYPSRTSILDLVKTIMKNPHSLKSKSTVGRIERVFRSAKDSGTSHPFLTILTIIVFAAAAFFWRRGRQRRTYQHHAGLGLNPGSMKEGNWTQGWFGSEKDGFFGSGGGGGKYD
ncbi:hypothetical protein ABW19_dt0201264 [Dactylella cylindrospora]|nr:hypothetical protein ABW19_dt0201264 [Dactylella cylindrospora]